ncbi:MAG: hypothetical protein NT178_10825 [Proteobacteria bacterium]|nr:hypothetical protein [Pseudomonadota bacterium]
MAPKTTVGRYPECVGALILMGRPLDFSLIIELQVPTLHMKA